MFGCAVLHKWFWVKPETAWKLDVKCGGEMANVFHPRGWSFCSVAGSWSYKVLHPCTAVINTVMWKGRRRCFSWEMQLRATVEVTWNKAQTSTSQHLTVSQRRKQMLWGCFLFPTPKYNKHSDFVTEMPPKLHEVNQSRLSVAQAAWLKGWGCNQNYSHIPTWLLSWILHVLCFGWGFLVVVLLLLFCFKGLPIAVNYLPRADVCCGGLGILWVVWVFF